MTILTKAFTTGNEKKGEEKTFPLVGDVEAMGESNPTQMDSDTKQPIDDHILVIHQMPKRRRASGSSIFLCFIALGVMCMGILVGVAIYRQYGFSQIRHSRFHGFCGVPYDLHESTDGLYLVNNKLKQMSNYDTDLDSYRRQLRHDNNNNNNPDNDDDDDNNNDEDNLYGLGNAESDIKSLTEQLYGPNSDFRAHSFLEEFELGLGELESYTKIDIPQFRDGRSGRFLHDFKQNESAIIDATTERCFVMPLDRETVLLPESMLDMIRKLYSGYYDIDTDVLRETMHVVLPAVEPDTVSAKIASECKSYKIYRLEKFVKGVYKRSAVELPQDGKFAQFSGKKIVEYDIYNIAELDEYEKNLKN